MLRKSQLVFIKQHQEQQKQHGLPHWLARNANVVSCVTPRPIKMQLSEAAAEDTQIRSEKACTDTYSKRRDKAALIISNIYKQQKAILMK